MAGTHVLSPSRAAGCPPRGSRARSRKAQRWGPRTPCQMQPTAVDKDCSLQARGCMRLQWQVAENAPETTFFSVPISSENQMVHVVQDFATLAVRSGMDQPPASLLADVDEQLSMRYFLKVFCALDD